MNATTPMVCSSPGDSWTAQASFNHGPNSGRKRGEASGWGAAYPVAFPPPDGRFFRLRAAHLAQLPSGTPSASRLGCAVPEVIKLPYFDILLTEMRKGKRDISTAFGRHVHWGYWDQAVPASR